MLAHTQVWRKQNATVNGSAYKTSGLNSTSLDTQKTILGILQLRIQKSFRKKQLVLTEVNLFGQRGNRSIWFNSVVGSLDARLGSYLIRTLYLMPKLITY